MAQSTWRVQLFARAAVEEEDRWQESVDGDQRQRENDST